MIADHAGASIGTVYRYFPDRVAVLSALRDRHRSARFRARVAFDIRFFPPELVAGDDLAISAFVDLYRTEPGFHIVHSHRAGRAWRAARLPAPKHDGPSPHSRDDEPFPVRRWPPCSAKSSASTAARSCCSGSRSPIEIADGLLSRAFRDDPDGDSRFIAECRVRGARIPRVLLRRSRTA